MITPAQPDMTGFESSPVNQIQSNRFFPAGGRVELLDQVIHLTRFGSLIVNVSGESGLGKTHLLQAVKASLPHTAIEVQASLLMSSTELLNQILHQLMANRFHHDLPDLPASSDNDTLLSLISSYLDRLTESASSIVLLIDDAHELTEEALLILFRILLDKKNLSCLKCVLFSEPTLSKLVLKAPLKDVGGEGVFTLQMPRMDLGSVAEYLHFLESTKPESERILYSEQDVSSIYELSEGKLGHVHAAIRSLLDREPVNKKVASSNYPKGHLVALGFVIVSVIAVAVLYQWNLSSSKVESVENVATVDDGEEVIRGQVLDSNRITHFETGSGSVSVRSDDGGEEKKVPTSLLAQLREKHKEIEAQKEVDKVELEQKEEVSIDLIDSSEELHSGLMDQEEQNPAPSNESVEQVKTESLNTEQNKTREWIMNRPKGHYTIQILGAHSERNVSRYVERFKGNKDDLMVYDAVLRGQPWYVLINGAYPTRAAAKEASRKLGLKDVWIRSYGSVQKEINNR